MTPLSPKAQALLEQIQSQGRFPHLPEDKVGGIDNVRDEIEELRAAGIPILTSNWAWGNLICIDMNANPSAA